jgi:hypothetical protein
MILPAVAADAFRVPVPLHRPHLKPPTSRLPLQSGHVDDIFFSFQVIINNKADVDNEVLNPRACLGFFDVNEASENP